MSRIPSTRCPLRMTSDLFLEDSFDGGVIRRVVGLPLGKGSCHCDYLGFVLLGRVIRGVTNVPVSICLSDMFCTPVKLHRATFLPLHGFPGRRVIPSMRASFLHKNELRKFIRSRTTTFVNNMSKGTNLFSAARSITEVTRV